MPQESFFQKFVEWLRKIFRPSSPVAPTPHNDVPTPVAPIPDDGDVPMPTPVEPAKPTSVWPLSTNGSKIVDANGRELVLTGVNWFGAETNLYVFHGLWARNWRELASVIIDNGFNCLRLPYSNDIFKAESKPNGIDWAKNPDLVNLTPLEIMDKVIDYFTSHGVMVILDRHRPDSNGQSELWYTDHVSEETWIGDWITLANRYKSNPMVIGADLHNEPRGKATWGTGDIRTDWRLAAERCGNAILAANPNWLIFVEGIESFENDWGWWGSQLRGARNFPVRLNVPNKLVYSTHDYSPEIWGQSWFDDPTFPRNLGQVWHDRWGYLVTEGIAPILVGEFGVKDVTGPSKPATWIHALIDYMKTNHMSYTFWCLNENGGDTGGLVRNGWVDLETEKLDLLKTYQWPHS